MFERFGDVAYVKVTPKKGCAFVHFYSRAQAKAALDAVHGMKLGAKHLRLSWGRHNTTKCAISSMLNGGQYPQYLPSPMMVPPQPMYVPTVPTPHTVPSVFTGMRIPMAGGVVYSMYAACVMPPPPRFRSSRPTTGALPRLSFVQFSVYCNKNHIMSIFERVYDT